MCYADGGPCAPAAAYRDEGDSRYWTGNIPAGRFDNDKAERVTRLADIAVQAMEASPEYREDDKIIVCVDKPHSHHGELSGGMAASGYASSYGDLFVTLMEHAASVIEATGQGRVEIERVPGAARDYTLRIKFTHTGKDVAAQFAAAFLKGQT